MKPKKYLYLIQCNNSNFYKIGISENPEERLRTLQPSCPYPLILIYKKQFKAANKIERFLHKRYKSKRGMGEWFELPAKEIKLIQKGQVMKELWPIPKYIPLLNKIRMIDSLPPIE